ncbi:guanylate cyclase alpha-like isoform X2 [Hylaeus volcanicus]|uniref:guanylate cyclase alpha-like isoform X2 n=1 Tax=Hylaeus volcanicus TaxID=313075 RepID=UPI0023B7B878|nr:guanylate cyclase alpha-like isoform X2 [Hylaeus volcanicus]
MMTGDHSELGLHIAYTSKIFQPTSIVFQAHISTNASKCSILLRTEIRSLYSRFCSLLQTRHIDEPVALLISGPEIELFLSSADLKVVFCSLICCSDAVVFCRMTPELKRRVIQLLKNKLTPSPIIFALGDGSNDIPMFKEADGGIVVMNTKQKCYAPCLNSLYVQIPSIKEVKSLFFVHGRLFSKRIWFATILVYYSAGLFLGEVVTLGYFTGNTYNFLYTFERLLFCQFFFCACIISIHSLYFKDIPNPIAENLPWAYLLSRREFRSKCPYIFVEFIKGFLTLIVSNYFITIPYFSSLTFYHYNLTIKDLYVDYTTGFLSCCVWEMIMETCHGLTKNSFLLYLKCIILWYFLLFLGYIYWIISFSKFFFKPCSDILIFDERHLSYWCRQPYILLVCFSVATSINLTRRRFFSTVLERFSHNLIIFLSNLYYQKKSLFKDLSQNTLLSQITSICNPLKKKNVKFLPLPVQYKLVQDNNRQHALTCNLPFVSDIDKLSVLVHLKSQHRQRHLSEDLEAPSFELLQMFWGTRFKFADFPKKKTPNFFEENIHITAPFSQRYSSHKNSHSTTVSSCKSIHSYTNIAGSLNSATCTKNSPHNLIHAKDYAHKKKEVHDFDFILHKTNHVRDTLNWITLRFHDPQLEIEYQKYRICSGENMEKVFYYIFFLIWTACVVNIVWDLRLFLGRETQDFFAVYYPSNAFLLDCLVVFLSFAIYYSIFHSEWFYFLIRFICIICTINKEIIHYTKCEDGASFASIISVLTFVILRIPFFYALLQNIVFMILFSIRYICTFQKCLGNIENVNHFFEDTSLFTPNAELSHFKYNATTSFYSVTHFAPFFIGIQILIGFVGYKLEYNERCGFFLSYQAHVARQKRREMLNTMLPSFVVEQYLRAALNLTRSLGTVEPKEHSIVSVVFCDVHNFEQLITNVKPTHLIQALDSLFLCFDKCVDFHKGAKVETVFETYLVATSLNAEGSSPNNNDTNHAHIAVEIGRSMLEIARCMVYQTKTVSVDASSYDNLKRNNKTKFERIHVRIGIHSGSVYSGVVGVKKPQYCLFGDTVNTASRMKSTGMCDRIHISQITYSFLKKDYKYKWEPRLIQVKGIGLMKTYLLQPAYEKSHYHRSSHQWVSSLSMFEINTSSSFSKDIKKIYQCEEMYSKDTFLNKSKLSKNSMILKPTSDLKTFQKTPLWIVSRSSTLSSSLSFNLYTKPFIFQCCIQCCHWCLRNFFFPIPTFLHIPSFTISQCKNNSNEVKTKHYYRKKLAPINSIVCPESKYYMFSRLLCFRNAFVEEKFCSQFYKNELNMSSIEQSLILFLILFITETWAILLLPTQNNVKNKVDIEYLHWTTRMFFNATLVFLFCLIRENFSSVIWKKVTRHFLIGILHFILLMAGTIIILTNIMTSVSLLDKRKLFLASFNNSPIIFLTLNFIVMTPKFSWFPSDKLQFFFYITILNSCSGLLFSQALAFNLTLITILCIIIGINMYKGLNSSNSCVLVCFLVVNLISNYLKESTDRTLFVANEELQLTAQRAQELLEDMLPRQILCEYQEDRLKLAYKHENMSFLFADICHFTPWAKRTEAKEVIRLLQQLFNQFDYYASCFNLFKLCTIGDAYIAVTEPLVRNESSRSAAAHGGKRVLQMAEAMTVAIKSMRSEKQIWDLGMRIGVHYGDCFGGMIGSGRLRYDLWGHDVITANTMESEGKPGHICASDSFCNLIEEEFPKQFDFQFYKMVNVCGKQVKTYLLANTCQNDVNKGFDFSIHQGM